MTPEAIRGLVERLRAVSLNTPMPGVCTVAPEIVIQAADAISSLQSKVETLQSELNKAEADANGEHIINRELNRMNVDLRSKVEVLERREKLAEAIGGKMIANAREALAAEDKVERLAEALHAMLVNPDKASREQARSALAGCAK